MSGIDVLTVLPLRVKPQRQRPEGLRPGSISETKSYSKRPRPRPPTQTPQELLQVTPVYRYDCSPSWLAVSLYVIMFRLHGSAKSLLSLTVL